MKGPGMRLELDVRRVWRCPTCGRESPFRGGRSAKLCGCTKEGVAMRLVELPRPKPTVGTRSRIDREHIPELADFPDRHSGQPAAQAAAGRESGKSDAAIEPFDEPETEPARMTIQESVRSRMSRR